MSCLVRKLQGFLRDFQAACANYVNEYNAKVLNGLSLELLALFQEEASEAKKRRRKIKEDFLNTKLQRGNNDGTRQVDAEG